MCLDSWFLFLFCLACGCGISVASGFVGWLAVFFFFMYRLEFVFLAGPRGFCAK